MASYLFAVLTSILVTATISLGSLPYSPDTDDGQDHENPFKKLEDVAKKYKPNEKPLLFKPTVGTNMSCKLLNYASVPTSVHRLRPSDIRVIGAVGDSITAGFGARSKTIASIMMEFRGMAWSIGGDSHIEQAATLANALKYFNPSIRGFSTGTAGMISKASHLNVAVAGAIAKNVPQQVRELVRRMRDDRDIDFHSDWKVVTLWIGANDLCAACSAKHLHSVKRYTHYIRNALDILHAEVPRLFVNLVTVIDVSKLHVVRTDVCDVLHAFSCACGTVLPEDMRNSTAELARAYQAAARDLIDSGRYDTREDFTVVVQRFFEEVEVPRVNGKVDKTFFAPDCFHLSPRGHAAAAVALWNSMLAPVGEKPVAWYPDEGMKCPSEEHPYFATAKNSGVKH